MAFIDRMLLCCSLVDCMFAENTFMLKLNQWFWTWITIPGFNNNNHSSTDYSVDEWKTTRVLVCCLLPGPDSERFFSLLSNTQGRRLDDQRVTLPSLPGIRNGGPTSTAEAPGSSQMLYMVSKVQVGPIPPRTLTVRQQWLCQQGLSPKTVSVCGDGSVVRLCSVMSKATEGCVDASNQGRLQWGTVHTWRM